MRTFETQGMIRRKQGSGTYVTQHSQVIESGLEVLESIVRLAERIGLQVSMGKHTIENRTATAEEAEALQLDQDSKVLSLGRVIVAEGRPVAYLIDVLPESILHPSDMDEQFSGSVLDLLISKGIPALMSSRCEISAVLASPEVARALGIQSRDVLLFFKAYLFDDSGHIVDYSFSYFIPGVFRFHVVRKIGR